MQGPKPRIPWSGQPLKGVGADGQEVVFRAAVKPAPPLSREDALVELVGSLAATTGSKGAHQFMTLPTAEAAQLSRKGLQGHGPGGKAAERLLFDELGFVENWAKFRFSGVGSAGSVPIFGGPIPG